jgi:hypothetical protein
VRSLLKRCAHRVRNYLTAPTIEAIGKVPSAVPAALSSAFPAVIPAAGPDAAAQVQLRLTYQQLVAAGHPLPRLGDVGFQCFSQTDEDGILLFLFAVLGTTNKLCAEICAGNGIECNTANLILNHGWHGLLVDGNQRKVERGKRFYAKSPHTYVYPPQFIHSWVTRDNVNALFRENGLEGEIDLLSLDLDGIDYWAWDAIEAVQPRVVVVEYQDCLGPDRAWTVPYADDFSASAYPTTNSLPNFCGASLPAFVKLGRRKGYRLVGVNRLGFNAFFVKSGEGDALLPEIDARECFGHPKVVWGMRERFPTVKDLPWVEV